MGIEQRHYRYGVLVAEAMRGEAPARRSLLRLLALTIGASPLMSSAGCSVLGGDSTPTVAATSPHDMSTVKRSVGGLELEVPEAWKQQDRTSGATGAASSGSSDGASASGDPWALTMVDPDGDNAPILAVSVPLPAKGPEQASEAAVSLLSSSFPDYRTTGSFSLTEQTNSASPLERTRTPAATTSGTEDGATPQAAAEALPSGGASATTGGDAITRLTFSYRRSDAPMQARAWIVPAQEYVVVALLKPDDVAARRLEASMPGAAS